MTRDEVYESCVESVRRFFISKVHRGFEVEDLVHETFLRLFEKMHNGLECEEPVRYLIGIAKNILRERWRARVDEPLDDEPLADPIGDVSIIDMLDHLRVRGLVHEVRRDFRTALKLYYWQDLPYRTIAAKLGIPVGTVGNRLFRSRQALRRILEPSWSNHHRRRNRSTTQAAHPLATMRSSVESIGSSDG